MDALVVAMHVNTCSPTNSPPSLCILDSDAHLADAFKVTNTPNALLNNTNDVIPTYLNVLQPPHISLPLISEVLAACHNHTDMSEISLTGTLPSDSIVAAVHSTNPHELLSLLVFKDERRTSQGHAPTTPASSPQSTRFRLAAHALLDTGSMAGDFVSKSLLVSLDALTHCYVSSHALNVCSGLDGTCYRCNTLVDLGLTFLDNSKIEHTIYVTFSVNPFAQMDLIIGSKPLNQRNLFVLTSTRMGFDPTVVDTSHSPDNIGLLPLRAQSDIGTDSHTDVCCHHSDAVESRSPCNQCRVITDTADNGDEGHSSTHRIPTVGEEWGPSALWTGSGLDRPPSETRTRVHTVTLNAASVLPCGINLNGDEIDGDKTDAFGPFLSALMEDPTPTGRANDVISTITFGGSEALQKACRALCTEFIDILQDEVAREPARIPPFDIEHKAAQWEVPGNC